MKKCFISMLTILLLVSALLAGCSSNITSYKNSSELKEETSVDYTSAVDHSEFVPIVDKDNTRYFSWHTDRFRSFQSLDELSANAPLIISGECIEATTVYKLNNIYTLSQVKVKDVYKGNVSSGDIIWVVECGGRTYFGDYDKNCMVDEKEFENKEDRLPADFQIVIGLDGYYPLKCGEEVLLFLGDTSGFLPDFNNPLYDVIGDTDGKLYVQENGSYKKASPSSTDEYIFDDNNLTITVEELKTIV